MGTEAGKKGSTGDAGKAAPYSIDVGSTTGAVGASNAYSNNFGNAAPSAAPSNAGNYDAGTAFSTVRSTNDTSDASTGATILAWNTAPSADAGAATGDAWNNIGTYMGTA